MGKPRASNDLSQLGGLVYSTNPEALTPQANAPAETTVPPHKQDLRITLDKRLKGGKQATIIYQFQGSAAALETLGKQLKTACGVGGSVKDGEIILQGNCLAKVQEVLRKDGYKFKLAGV